MTRKRYLRIIVTAIGLFIFGMLMLFLAAILEDTQFNQTAVNIIGFSCFLFFIISLVILFKNHNRLIQYEILRKAEQVKNDRYHVINKSLGESIDSLLKNKDFKFIGENTYHRRTFSFFKDIITYIVNVSEINDFKNDLLKQCENIDNIINSSKLKKRMTKCIFLIGIKYKITDNDIRELINFSINQYAISSQRFTFLTIIPIYYEEKTERFIFKYINKKAIGNLYKIGINYFKKIIG